MSLKALDQPSTRDRDARKSLLMPPSYEVNGNIDFPAVLKGKRILLATESLGPINGVSKTTGQLIEYLRHNGVNVAVVAPEISPSKINTSLIALANLRLFGWPLPYNPDLTVVYPFRLDHVFRRTFIPDLIYLASPASVGFQVLLQTRQIRDAPPVLCNFQTDLSSYSEIIFPRRMDTFAVWLLGVVQGYLFNGPSVRTVFYPCSDVRRYLESTGVHSNKLAHLGRGVDTVMFRPDRRDDAYRKELAPNGRMILVCVSRLAPEKGFDFLAKAAMKLAASVDFTLLIVGGNRNPAVQSEVESYFNPIKDRVVFTGFLSGIPLARAYASADVFLHCSITETFGLVVLESMASGVPVVARDQGGPSEIVQDGSTGHLIPPHDLDGFVSKVKGICTDEKRRLELAVASRQVALESTWEKINNRAAWYIADGLQTHEALRHRAELTKKHEFFVKRVIMAVVARVHERLGLWISMTIVSGFWLIACIPLILHGTLTFKAS